MKFRCERDLLVDALNVASKAVTNRGTLPVLHGLRLDLSSNELVITGSDLDLTITVSVEVGGEKDGVTVVPAKLLADVVRAVEPGAVDITAEDTNLHVVAGRSEFSLRTIPKDEYPNFEEPTTSPVTVDGEDLVRALEQVTPAASSDDVMNAAKKAQAYKFIQDLTDIQGRSGFDAHLGERGVKLSGGQRQRIALARAILKNAPVLILDEATSALDSETEAQIQDALDYVMKDKTVFAIAHRLSTIVKMDRIILLHEGQIVEQGSHGELLTLGGLYSKYWARQSGGFIGIDQIAV